MIEPNIGRMLSAEAAGVFVVLSRFEGSMVAAGFVTGIKIGKRAEVDWVELATALKRARFFDSVREVPEIKVLINEPPQKLMLTAPGKAEWRPWDQKIIEETKLLEAVRQVRNNLFHGGKLWIRPRDTQLMQAALAVFSAILEVSRADDGKLGKLGRHFHDSDFPSESEAAMTHKPDRASL